MLHELHKEDADNKEAEVEAQQDQRVSEHVGIIEAQRIQVLLSSRERTELFGDTWLTLNGHIHIFMSRAGQVQTHHFVGRQNFQCIHVDVNVMHPNPPTCWETSYRLDRKPKDGIKGHVCAINNINLFF